jgi:peptidyl-prolyl cis-trans isomerase D
MLSWIRGLLENWVARVFFGLLVLVFVFWGISNVLTLVGNNSAVARIGGKPVDISLVQSGYQAQLEQARQSGTAQPDLAARQQLAAAALNEVLRQQALQLEQQTLGLAAPPATIRQLLYAMPAFQNGGVFSQAQFHQLLLANNKSEAQFLGEIKSDVLNRQLLLPAVAGVAPPAELVNQVFAYVAEQRFAELVTIPFAAQPKPAPPADALLSRYWRNHQDQFAAPEIRQVKIVLLSRALLATRETVSDSDVAAAYARATAGQHAVPLRSVQVITAADAGKAKTLAARWQAGASWAQMQALAKQQNASAVELDKAAQTEIPDPLLAAAVFAAKPGVVTGPAQGSFGSFVFAVTGVQSNLPNAAALQAQIKQQLQLQKAQADVAQDVDNVQDALAGQTPLDRLPGNLGLVAVQGSLDVHGNTEDGTPAPIPGDAALKAAVVKAAFAAHPNDPPQLINGPDNSYFAVSVDSVAPPSIHPYDQVKAQVLSAWTQDQIMRAAEQKAAALLAAVNGGQTLDAAATAGGYSVTMSPPVTRNVPPAGISTGLQQILFSLKPGQATMQQQSDGFAVAALAKIVNPSVADDPSDYAQSQAAMAKSMQDDVAQSLFSGLQARDNVHVDQKLFAQIYQ